MSQELVPLIIASGSSSPGKGCCRSPALHLPWDSFPYLFPVLRHCRSHGHQEGQSEQRAMPRLTRRPRWLPACLPVILLPGCPLYSMLRHTLQKSSKDPKVLQGKEGLYTLTSPSTNNYVTCFCKMSVRLILQVGWPTIPALCDPGQVPIPLWALVAFSVK